MKRARTVPVGVMLDATSGGTTPITPLIQSTTGGGPYFECWRCHDRYGVGCVHYCGTGRRVA